ncbi:hypothetical protein [Streptomyces hoynatensis]|uniref:Glycosyltransferase n=1 Tax=Streptomyces hoynatensis TaxID=1141874 RepID=A0A3A9Z081_9ACTN|nr:hypothetical protein [Streptomyces hoynatensis]RKN40836.1 hypothetical protein D7294_17325 [Streptomyces hoynatensis]
MTTHQDAAGASQAGPRLLVNAEPFGFGPAAAASALAAELAPDCARLDYVGGGHTLDLQHRPPYHAVHDTTGLSGEEVLRRLRAVAPRYDLFVTAMDFRMAELAGRAGLPVALYDALTWYWPRLPAAARAAELYLAQDFFGVRERLAADPALGERALVVPPLAPPRRRRRPGRHVLVNLGGLQNPYWEPGDALAYARLLLGALRAAPVAPGPLVVTTSRQVAAALGEPGAGPLPREEVLDLMGTAAFACMTPGLGNIYDAAATGVPTLWLPAANASHPAQVRLLERHGYCDARLDWADVGRPVDYGAADPEVSRALARLLREAAGRAGGEAGLRAELAARIAESTRGLAASTGKAQGLLDQFGHGGARRAAHALLRRARRRS